MSLLYFKKRGHTVRNEHGVMTAKISANVLNAMLERYGDYFTLSADRTKYIYHSGDGIYIGNSELVKIYLWEGYTVECASKEM